MSTIEQYNNIRCGVCGRPWHYYVENGRVYQGHPRDTVCDRHRPVGTDSYGNRKLDAILGVGSHEGRGMR
jgi:hypothetical protein